jgi:hypothetical protein
MVRCPRAAANTNLTDISQDAARALPFFEQEAKKRQTGRPKTGEQKSSPIGGDLRRDHLAVDDAAIAFDTSPRNVQRGKLCLPHWL